MLRLEIKPYTLDFKFSARTSRGVMNDRKVWFLKVTNELGQNGVGEVAPIDRLSPEESEDVPEKLAELSQKLSDVIMPASEEEVFDLIQRLVPHHFPSVRFGLETALLDLLNGSKKVIFNHSPESISLPINGLVWMGDVSFMKKQVREKLEQGFDCIKLKVGALDFDTEVRIIKELRTISHELIIRLDANGAFPINEVLFRLKQLSKYHIHSIEQPILPMQPEAMQLICEKSEIPIALDEELIHVFSSSERLSLLQELKPQYIVLKPTLHGGFASTKEWIDLAEMHGIKWWITSYLESNVGLNAIGQFASLFENDQHHGLGTGDLYINNIPSAISVTHGRFQYIANKQWGKIPFY